MLQGEERTNGKEQCLREGENRRARKMLRRKEHADKNILQREKKTNRTILREERPDSQEQR